MPRFTSYLVVAVLTALAVGTASAQQYGGPSGPAAGEWRIGVESNWRSGADATLVGWG